MPSCHHAFTPSSHHAITPSLHHFITPSLHQSITPSLHLAITPSCHTLSYHHTLATLHRNTNCGHARQRTRRHDAPSRGAVTTRRHATPALLHDAREASLSSLLFQLDFSLLFFFYSNTKTRRLNEMFLMISKRMQPLEHSL
jgi:hypothetical protein